MQLTFHPSGLVAIMATTFLCLSDQQWLFCHTLRPSRKSY